MGYFTAIYAEQLLHRAKSVYMYLKEQQGQPVLPCHRYYRLRDAALLQAGYSDKGAALAGERRQEQPALYFEADIDI